MCKDYLYTHRHIYTYKYIILKYNLNVNDCFSASGTSLSNINHTWYSSSICPCVDVVFSS